MSFDPTGEWGLRFRLRVAIRQGYSYDSLAILLHVDPGVLQTYLTDPTYVLSPGDTNNVLAHIYDVEAPDVFYDRTTTAGGTVITYVEAPYWTEELLEGVMPPDGAQVFKVNYLSESEEHRVMSSRLYDLESFDVLDVVLSLTGGDLERLVSIVFYAYNPISA